MPNKVILNDRVGIPNRLWPIRSELTEPQCKARHLGSPETQQEWGAPFCSNSSFSCLGKDPASLTQPIFVYISHTQEAGTMHACAALCLTENSVSHGWLTSKRKEIHFSIFLQAVQCIPHMNLPSPNQEFIQTVVQLLQQNQGFLL